MRKRNISLARAYLAFYILFVFSAAIPVLLTFRFSITLSIVVLVVEFLCLAGVIVSNVFYDKKIEKVFYITGIASFGLFDLLILYGFVLELVYTIQGKPATYAWIISIASILIYALISFFVGFGMYRTKHPIEKV